MTTLPDFHAIHLADQKRLGRDGAYRLLDTARQYDLSSILQGGGAILFPHASLNNCGHMIGAAVHACLDSGADRIIALGVLHALTAELRHARNLAASGTAMHDHPLCGIQGQGFSARNEWIAEFSLLHFQVLLTHECTRRGRAIELITCYPFLANGEPATLPGISEVERIARDAVIVATADHVHHGIGYGDPPSSTLSAGRDGEEFARHSIENGMALLGCGDYRAFESHCSKARSDARDTGSVLRHLIGTFKAEVVEVLCDDMSVPYGCAAPTWVAAGLVGARKE